MSEMSTTFDLIIFLSMLGVGVYTIVGYLKQRKSKEVLDHKIMCPGGSPASECKNPAGFIAYILPRAFIFGIIITVFGAGLGYCYFRSITEKAILLICTFTPVVVLIWFAIVLNKARKLFW